MFHFKFETEIRHGLKMMKYVYLHPGYFDSPPRAFFLGFIQASMIFLVELVNLWNLSNITGGTSDLMFDFIALGIIAEFDDYFVEIYKSSNLEPLLEVKFTFENVLAPKRAEPSSNEQKMVKALRKIRDNLKDLKEHFIEFDAANDLNKPAPVRGDDFSLCE